MKKWVEEGFVRGYAPNANPRLFGVGIADVVVPVGNFGQADRIFEELNLVEGTVSAYSAYGENPKGEPFGAVVVQVVDDHSDSVQRRIEHIKKFAPLQTVFGPFPSRPPPCPESITPLQWRIVQAVMADPTATPTKLAASAKVSLKTLLKHYNLLLDSDALLFPAIHDWSRTPTVVLGFLYTDEGTLPKIQRELSARFERYLPVAVDNPLLMGPDFMKYKAIWTIVIVHGPAHVHTLLGELAAIPGVVRVVPFYLAKFRHYPEWRSQRLREKLGVTRAAA
ncbi:MAG TPA: hypothetical protein VJS68_03835, partial [Thermoplasmata archaeon]|nr:hypothetical protein [Thermoplasmata archaeon]